VQDKNGNWIFDSKTQQPDIKNNHINSSEVEGEVEVTNELDRITAADLSGYGDRPLWVVHRIVNKGVGISMVVFRIHHVITDGIGLLDVFTNMFLDSRTNKPIHNPVSESMRSADKKGGNKLSLFASMISCFVKILALPLSSFDTNIAFSSKDKKSLKMGKNMKTVIFPTVRLDFIKALKNKAGVTVNDIMLSATGGAIRRYCEKRGEKLPADILCRALMPVAFPRPSSEKENPQTALRNKWAFMSVSTPVKEDSSKDRVVNCSKITTLLKNSPMAYVQFWIQTNLLPLLPKSQGQQTAYDMFARHSMIFSNVLGTDAIPLFCNEKVMGLQVVFPNLLPQVILMSMGKQVFITWL
jgi:diacylglycerol O-acyltransferase / wax synthase